MGRTFSVTSRPPGRPSLGPRIRLVLTCAVEHKDELLRHAAGEPLTSFVLTAARYYADHRPRARAERCIATLYTWESLHELTGPIMQVRRDTYADGRSVDSYTGIQYPDTTSANADCLALNVQPPRGDGPRATPAPGGALTTQDGG
jgi:hypothetical protein